MIFLHRLTFDVISDEFQEKEVNSQCEFVPNKLKHIFVVTLFETKNSRSNIPKL